MTLYTVSESIKTGTEAHILYHKRLRRERRTVTPGTSVDKFALVAGCLMSSSTDFNYDGFSEKLGMSCVAIPHPSSRPFFNCQQCRS